MLWLFIVFIVGFYVVLFVCVYVWTSFVQIVEDVEIEVTHEQEQSKHYEMDVWKGEKLNGSYEMAWEIEK